MEGTPPALLSPIVWHGGCLCQLGMNIVMTIEHAANGCAVHKWPRVCIVGIWQATIPEAYQFGDTPSEMFAEMHGVRDRLATNHRPLNDERGHNRCVWLNRAPTSE